MLAHLYCLHINQSGGLLSSTVAFWDSVNEKKVMYAFWLWKFRTYRNETLECLAASGCRSRSSLCVSTGAEIEFCQQGLDTEVTTDKRVCAAVSYSNAEASATSSWSLNLHLGFLAWFKRLPVGHFGTLSCTASSVFAAATTTAEPARYHKLREVLPALWRFVSTPAALPVKKVSVRKVHGVNAVPVDPSASSRPSENYCLSYTNISA